MDPSDFPVSKSPRKELQGPRPTPLKVRKDSHKIKKPPVVPPQRSQPPQQQQPGPPAQLRPPVIIYTVSPKVIHTNPSDFMNLVQRLTGSSSSSSTSSSSSQHHDHYHRTGAISPAARYASIEKTKPSSPGKNKQQSDQDHNMGFVVEGIEMDHNLDRSNLFPGILSPGPTSLPNISPSFFSPLSDPNLFSFFHDLSPVMHGNKNFIEGSFMPSPSFISPRYPPPNISPSFFSPLSDPNLFSFIHDLSPVMHGNKNFIEGSFISPRITSPTPSVDLFNNFFDL